MTQFAHQRKKTSSAMIPTKVVYAALAVLGCAVGLGAAWHVRSYIHTPQRSFAKSAEALGLTESARQEVRSEFSLRLIEMEADPCNYTRRKNAGRAAVAYYETVLEKPFVAARLTIAKRGICETSKEEAGYRMDPFSLVHEFRKGLRLPWDCLPIEWRTPEDLALQAKLEANIRNGLLNAQSLTGTLGVLSTPWELSPYAARCQIRPTSHSHDGSRRSLPLISSPPDDWVGSRRRR